MNLTSHLIEQVAFSSTTEEGQGLNKDFDLALRNVFSPAFYQKIEKVLKNNIKIIPFSDDSGNMAYNVHGNIYINEKEFAKLTQDRKIAYILHEFVHVLQRKKTAGVFSSFKEVLKVSQDLYNLVVKNLTGSLSMFLIGKEEDLGPLKQIEVLAYLMNSKIRWQFLKPEAKKEFISILKNSGLFNLQSSFWKDRL